jgi:hypothetical protein
LALYLPNLKINGREVPDKTPDSILSEVKGVIEQIQTIEEKKASEQPLVQINPTLQLGLYSLRWFNNNALEHL